jgi:hypothetical protein
MDLRGRVQFPTGGEAAQAKPANRGNYELEIMNYE